MAKYNQSAFEFNKAVHETLTSICSSLFTNFDIQNFRYMRIFNNYKYLSLGTNLEYLRCYLEYIEKPGHIFSFPLAVSQEKKFYYFLWPDNYLGIYENDPLLSLLYSHNVWNGISLCRKHKEYVETWSFATSKDHTKIKQFYINNLHLLEYFIILFENQAHDLINNIHPSKLAAFHSPFDLNLPSEDTENKILQFLDENKITKLFIDVKGKSIYLTKREVESLSYAVLGKTIKEISIILNISLRTVEKYLNSIRMKTGISSKSSLVSAIPVEQILPFKYMLEKYKSS